MHALTQSKDKKSCPHVAADCAQPHHSRFTTRFGLRLSSRDLSSIDFCCVQRRSEEGIAQTLTDFSL